MGFIPHEASMCWARQFQCVSDLVRWHLSRYRVVFSAYGSLAYCGHVALRVACECSGRSCTSSQHSCSCGRAGPCATAPHCGPAQPCPPGSPAPSRPSALRRAQARPGQGCVGAGALSAAFLRRERLRGPRAFPGYSSLSRSAPAS